MGYFRRTKSKICLMLKSFIGIHAMLTPTIVDVRTVTNNKFIQIMRSPWIKIYKYNFTSLEKYHKIPTNKNPTILPFYKSMVDHGNYARANLWNPIKIAAAYEFHFPLFLDYGCNFGQTLINGRCQKWLGCK